MIFIFDRYYHHNKKLPLNVIFFEIAKIAAHWGTYYDIGLPYSYHQPKDQLGNHETGFLSGNYAEKESKIENLLGKYTQGLNFEDVEGSLLLKIFADQHDTAKPIFDYDNDINTWNLNLSYKQFTELQQELAARGLPGDIFFSNDQWIHVKEKDGSVKYYSPREWKSR